MKNFKKKRVDIVRLKLVRDSSIMLEPRIIRDGQDASKLLTGFIGEADREHFAILCLNAKMEPTCMAVTHIGTLDRVQVYPRDIFKIAIVSNAKFVIVSHNHPSGDVTPSTMDNEVTKTLITTGILLGVPVIDHIIVSSSGKTHSLKTGNPQLFKDEENKAIDFVTGNGDAY
jgi:DNA repair protein RadC